MTIMKENCQLHIGMTSDDLDVLELIRGVHSDELRRKMLKVKEPKPNELIKIAPEYVHAVDMEKNFKAVSSAHGAKATGKDSDYKKGKAKTQQQRAAEVAATKAASEGKRKSKELPCFGCGKVQAELQARRKECPNKDKTCSRCKGKCRTNKFSHAKKTPNGPCL